MREGTAQALFDEATELFARGDYEHACAKFQASDELDPKGGTLLNLAVCREKEGRTASAWTAYTGARNRSLKEGRAERVAFADKKIAELRPLLPLVRIVVQGAVREIVVKVDEQPFFAAAWNTAVPIDPGEHRIEASAPGHRSVALSARAVPREEVTVTVPPLVALPAQPPRDPAIEPPPTSTAAPVPRWPGYVALGGGALALGLGTVFGVQAFGKRSDAESLCASGRCDEGRSANDAGIRDGWISNVSLGVGVVAAVVGAYLLLREGPAPTRGALSQSRRPAP